MMPPPSRSPVTPPVERPWVRPAVVAAVAVVVVAVIVAIVVVVTNGGAKTSGKGNKAGNGAVTIPVDGDAALSALVASPPGKGPFPLVVMPGSWSAAATEYARAMPALVQRGFVVVSYAQRGVGGSTGSVDFAGPQTQKDVSSVIDWALKNTAADRKRVSAAGISYGAAMSLMAAGRDSRIRAVVALSGYGDFYDTLAPNGAASRAAILTLLGSAQVRDHLTDDAQTLLEQTSLGNWQAVDAQLHKMADARSPDRYIPALNRNHTAVMLSNAFQDSIVPPAAVLRFYSALTGPKRLQMAPGDHGAPELTMLLGQQNPVWTEAIAWLQRYGAGTKDVAGTESGVVLTDSVNQAVHTYPDVAAITGSVEKLYLNGQGGTTITSTPTTGWTTPLQAGANSLVDLPTFVPSPYYQIPRAPVTTLQLPPGKFWIASTPHAAATISGIPTLRIAARSSSAAVSFVAYLYDVGPDNQGSLITYAPVNDAVPAGQLDERTLQFQPISWTLAAGHRLGLLIDGVDKRYLAGATGTITFDATSAPVELDVPLAPA